MKKNYLEKHNVIEHFIIYFNNNLSCKNAKKEKNLKKVFRKSKTFVEETQLRFKTF